MKKNVRQYSGKDTLEVLSWAENYNKWIASQFFPQIHGKKVLDIGAGVGTISKLLSSYALSYDITDIDPELYLPAKLKNGKNSRIRYFFLDIEKNIPKHLEHTYDIIITVNVLEHIEHDTIALKNMRRLLKKNGKLLILVPAKKFAYTGLDRKLGHFRRYEKDELENRISDAGLYLQNIYYFNCIGLVTWIIRNIFERDSTQLKPYQIRFFENLVPILSKIESVIHPPVGISLIAIARCKS